MGYVRILALMATMVVAAYGHSKYQPVPYLDKVDRCIVTCDQCYKSIFLVNCANDCITENGNVASKWIRGCPQFVNMENDVLDKSKERF